MLFVRVQHRRRRGRDASHAAVQSGTRAFCVRRFFFGAEYEVTNEIFYKIFLVLGDDVGFSGGFACILIKPDGFALPDAVIQRFRDLTVGRFILPLL